MIADDLTDADIGTLISCVYSKIEGFGKTIYNRPSYLGPTIKGVTEAIEEGINQCHEVVKKLEGELEKRGHDSG